MSTMNEAQAAKWRAKRTMGKGKYVVYYGMLMWGLLLTLLFTVVELLSQQTFSMTWLYIRLAVFGIIGFFIANFGWDAKEIKLTEFDKLKEASRPSPSKKKR
ncbi:hypothetical protein [Paenibacillus cremeus]|uniref:hypothetical protein n=1 Tax=Paenibacillus cremeus TaxID=2163881 RepID=UPI00164942FB|nr:hypothetical protein [Paenibacillus cremeus]